MKLNFIEEDPKSLVVEFVDADRSTPEMIKAKLIDNKDIEFVGVVKEHPNINRPKLIVKSTKDAKKLVLKAIEELEDDMKDLASSLPKK